MQNYINPNVLLSQFDYGAFLARFELILSELLVIFILLAGVWLWFDSISAREKAITLGSNLAERYHLQLLDETVACVKIRLARNSRGRVLIERTYEFEVSASGAERLSCHVVLLGLELQSWYIPPYAQATQ